MREASKRLYAQLQDAEKKHHEDREQLLVSHFHFLAFVSFIAYKDSNVINHIQSIQWNFCQTVLREGESSVVLILCQTFPLVNWIRSRLGKNRGEIAHSFMMMFCFVIGYCLHLKDFSVKQIADVRIILLYIFNFLKLPLSTKEVVLIMNHLPN